MRAGWVAGGIRARALLNRRLGVAGARELASSASARAAISTLAQGPYGHSVYSGQSLADAEHGVVEALLWQLRVLAGWQPRQGAEIVRVLAAGLEMANVVELARELSALKTGRYFDLGRLSTAWPRLREAASTTELAELLATTPWRDPEGITPAAIASSLGLEWARRVMTVVPEAAGWAAGGAALLTARLLFLDGRPVEDSTRRRMRTLLGDGVAAGDWDGFTQGLRHNARWPLAGVGDPGQLWRAENAWWVRMEREARALLSTPKAGRAVVVGCVGMLAADARRVRAALHCAARGGRALGVYDAVV
ncbi:hypothetical protein Snas_3457 [Stackebrandtia nassauensis DSM 44728]|uniref:Uncharacterized protein n=1 Tax=Stackebrandtia nassauensis (strain DSM 44728 / CIP 108903 / NRRL B-16338 / NBRC 102104 / LLR-40K-21) TaxID=446470 RepID=D3PVK7_STANL|nr:hypothetical protein Snas_3457 [Stackebrandtia nassauensis DSM 44728]